MNPPRPGLRTIRNLLAVAIPLSLVHYTDNAVNYDVYPKGSVGPVDITQTVVWVSWLVFAAAGIAGYLLYRAGTTIPGLVLIAVFSGSGLISLGHYSVPGMSKVEAWRHVFIWVDILWGAAIFGFTLWAVQANRRVAPATEGVSRA
jgi:hypothetical protein